MKKIHYENDFKFVIVMEEFNTLTLRHQSLREEKKRKQNGNSYLCCIKERLTAGEHPTINTGLRAPNRLQDSPGSLVESHLESQAQSLFRVATHN